MLGYGRNGAATQSALTAESRNAVEAWPTRRRRWALSCGRAGRIAALGVPLSLGRQAQGNGPRRSFVGAARRCAARRRRRRAGYVASRRNPIDARRAADAKREAATTFGAFADALVADISHGFRNAKHRAQWATTLKTYAAPLRDKGLDEITTEDVLAVLKPIWRRRAKPLRGVRGRIERVLDAAKAKGLRSGDNPARWRGHLANLLPKRQKLTRGHHAAMPYATFPASLPVSGSRRRCRARGPRVSASSRRRVGRGARGSVGRRSTARRRSGSCRRRE